MLDHVVHAAEVAGVETVGIGSDFDGVPALPQEIPDIRMLPLLTEGLLDRGFHQPEIEAILGRNLLRVFGEVESARK